MRRRPTRRPATLVAGLAAAMLVAATSVGVASHPSAQPWAVSTPSGTGGTNDPAVVDRDYVLMVSFDGFAVDYLDRFDTPTFDWLAQTGAVAESLIPVFPALTFPAHYTIATGLYPDRHGIVGNQFYDPDRGEGFSYRDAGDVQNGTWWGGEPIWVTAERQGMVAATYFFPGTEAPIGGLRPTHWHPYDGSVPNEARVDEALRWLGLPAAERPHLIALYFSLVDTAGHRLGAESPQLAASVATADDLLSQLVSGIASLPHGDRVYLLVLSDHGMATRDESRRVVLTEAVELAGVRVVPLVPGLSLHVESGPHRPTEIRDAFNAAVDPMTARAYLRAQMPPHLRVSNPRFGDVVVLAEAGATVVDSPDGRSPLGLHGWDPRLRSMHGIFLARGPTVVAGQRIPSFELIHIYPYVAHLLGLTPNPTIDGELSVLATLADPR